MSNTFETYSANITNDEWKFWCRLCAKGDTQNINVLPDGNQSPAPAKSTCSNKLISFIQEFFRVHIAKDEDLPHWLCTECFSLVSNLIKFADRVKKVQRMYDAIQHLGESQTLDLRVFREKYNLLGDELLKFHSLDTKPEVENVFIAAAPEIMVQKSFDSIVKTEIISDEVQSGSILNEIEYKSEFQDPIGDEIENIGSEVESANSRNDSNEDKCFRNDRGELIAQFSEQHVKKPNKKLKTRLCRFEEESEGHKYFCSDCSMHFQRISNYRVHMKKKHGRIDKDVLTCPQCPRSFETRFKLNHHIKTHRPLSEKRIFPCPQCDRKFQTKDYVARHIKFVHEDIRPFICEECGEAKRTEVNLRDHMLIHTDLAPFECEICKKGFKSQASLKKHIEIHSSSKHICKVCGLQLNSRVTLNRHMLVHSDVMSHKCDYCGRAFKRAKALKSHLILHSGLKPYSCDFCDKTFANASNCRTHKKRSHPEEFAALEASGGKTYTRNIPKLAVLKTLTRSAENLTPVVSKQSGNFSLGRKANPPPDSSVGTKHSNSPPGLDVLVATVPSSNQTNFKENTSGVGISSTRSNIQSSFW